MSLPLACLGQQADLLGQEVDRLHGPVTLVRRCGDLVELLAVVRSGLALAVLVDADEPELTAPALDALHRDGAVVAVVVHEPLVAVLDGAEAEDAPDDRLAHDAHDPASDAIDWQRLGALEVPAQLPARQIAQRLLEAAEGPRFRPGDPPMMLGGDEVVGVVDPGRGAPGQSEGSGNRLDADHEDPEAAWRRLLEEPEQAVGLDASSGLPPRGRVVVVWGPHGSPGRSTVAINLAAELAQQGVETTLVDLDTWGPSTAALLGLLDETAGVALACRAADRDRLSPEALERAAVEVQVGRGRLMVLTGITRPERWPELRAGSVRRMLRACQHMPRALQLADGSGAAPSRGPAPVIVVDVGASLEEDEELVSEIEMPRRSAATTAALAEADLVLAVCSAEVLGIPRAARALPGLLELTPAPVMLVANRVRRSAAGSSPRAALKEAWAAIGAPGQWDAHLSWEPKTVDAAALAGSVLAESAPSSSLRAQLRDLAGSVLRRLDGDLGPEQDAEEIEDVRGTRLGRAVGGWLRR